MTEEKDLLPPIGVVVQAKCIHSGKEETHLIRRIKTKDTAKGLQWSDFEINSYFTLKVVSWKEVKPMTILYDYKPYSAPKKALYFQTGTNYVFDPNTGISGWERVEVETTVIGEDNQCYIEKLVEHTISDTTNPDYAKTVLLPIGFHKSRLLKWMPTYGQQLNINF